MRLEGCDGEATGLTYYSCGTSEAREGNDTMTSRSKRGYELWLSERERGPDAQGREKGLQKWINHRYYACYLPTMRKSGQSIADVLDLAPNMNLR